MPKKLLTDRFVSSVTTKQRDNFFDTKIVGLVLRVTPAGSKSWAFTYRVNAGGPQWLTMGSYPETPLTKAREKAKAYRVIVDDKRDPGAEQKAAVEAAKVPPTPTAPVMTVRKFAPAFITFQKGKKKSWEDDQQKVDLYLLPAWGDLPLASINRTMIAELLTTIASERDITVGLNRIQSCISRFFAIAINQGVYPDINPAARMIKRFKETARTRILSEKEIRTLHTELQARPGEPADVYWLRLILGQRAEEIAGMVWTEVNLEERIWKVNAIRTKNGLEHWVWLPDMALEILTRRKVEGQKYVFPSLAGERQPKAERDLSVAVKAVFEDFEWKDLRRTFSTGLGDLGIDDGVIDRLLNHKAASVGRRHYNHAKYLPEQQVALAAWNRELSRILKHEPKTSRVLVMPTR